MAAGEAGDEGKLSREIQEMGMRDAGNECHGLGANEATLQSAVTAACLEVNPLTRHQETLVRTREHMCACEWDELLGVRSHCPDFSCEFPGAQQSTRIR